MPDHSPLATRIYQVLQTWRIHGRSMGTLEGVAAVDTRVKAGHRPDAATYAVLTEAIATLATRLPRHAKFLDLHFVQRTSIRSIGAQDLVGWRESTLYVKQWEAIEALAHLLQSQESPVPPSAPSPWLPDYRSDVIGADARLATLVPLLEPGTSPWLIGMVGVGGTGKSTLARAVVETLRLTGTYPMVVWVQSSPSVTARWDTTPGMEARETLTVARLIETIAVQVLGEDTSTAPDTRRYLENALRARFRETPHLIVLDNVESVPAFPEVLRLLQGWVKPGKVLLLSRTQRWHTHQVVTYRVPPLDAEEAIAFIRQEAQAHHFTALLTCTPDVLVSLYELVGGHPLALRLLIGHIEQYGIAPSLRRFREAKGIGRDLYDFVYTETWQGLSDTTRQVAMALLLTAEEGGTVHDMRDATGMEEDDILDALAPLIAHNWVDIGGDALLRYYTLHHLTRLFVQQQIAL